MDQNRAACLKRHHALYKQLKGVYKARAKADLEEFYSKLADEAEARLEYNNWRLVFCAIKRMQGGSNQESREVPITKSDDSACRSIKETLDRWREYYGGMLNHTAATPCTGLYVDE